MHKQVVIVGAGVIGCLLGKILKNNSGLYFVHVKCNLDNDYPRPTANEIINSKDSFK